MSDFLNNDIWFILGVIFGCLGILFLLYFSKLIGNYRLTKYLGSPGIGHTYVKKDFNKLKK